MFTTLATTRPFFDLGATLDQMFEGRPFFEDVEKGNSTGFSPRVNLGEHENAYFIEVDLPGVSMKEIEVTVDGRELMISGERVFSAEEGTTFRKRECLAGRFERVFNLPEFAETEKIDASSSNGVLTVRIPKTEIAKPRRIEVKTS